MSEITSPTIDPQDSQATRWADTEGSLREARANQQRAARLRSEAAGVYHSVDQEGADQPDHKAALEAGRTGKTHLGEEYPGQIIEDIFLRKNEFINEANNILGPKGSDERNLLKFSGQQLVKALREDRRLELKQRDILEGEMSEDGKLTPGLVHYKELKKKNERQGKSSDHITEQIALKEAELAELAIARESLKHTSPEAFYALNLKEIRNYHDQLMEGRIVETPYVKKQAEEMTNYLEAGLPVLIHGHLGAGKTELSMYVAKEYLGKEALVISGSKHTGLADFYGHQVLAIGSAEESQAKEMAENIEKSYNQWLADNSDKLSSMSESEAISERQMAHDRLTQAYVSMQGSGTVSDFFLGPVYRAMAEGRPIIIDEVNAIPHEVLISLNHILTRKPGDEVPVQQNSGSMVTVAEGFCIIMTGNLEKNATRYVQRQELDAAFLSRLHVMEHDYLPQTLEGGYKVAAEEGSANEQFAIILASLVDRRGRAVLPEGSYEKLWNLAKAARLIQDVFSGKQLEGGMFSQGGDTISGTEILDKSVLSIRTIDKILRIWREDNYKYELDHYLYSEFIAASPNPSERAYLYQILRDQFDFFRGEGWPADEDLDYGSNGIVNSFGVSDPMRLASAKRFYSTEDTVEALYGNPPQRQEFPELSEEAKQQQLAQEVVVQKSKMNDIGIMIKGINDDSLESA